MSWLGFAGDEELGKKNDDHRPVNGAAKSTTWSARKTTPAFRKRRIIYGICALLFIYVFVQNIPTDLGPSPRFSPGPHINQGEKLPPGSSDPPTKKPRKPPTPSEAEEHYHDGPIKFYLLASSLHSVARLGGQHESNKNVLFAASNLKSVSEIIPLACEMARWDRNDVHFAVMGRDDMEMQEIKKLNGAEEDCNVHWHGKGRLLSFWKYKLSQILDARPDYSRWSSDFRMEVSVTASLEHIQTFIHPQVILVDDPSREDAFFTTAIRSKAMEIGKSVIELPSDSTESMMWITRLDSESLAADEDSIVTIHDELYQVPEEYAKEPNKLDSSVPDLNPDAPLTKDYDTNDRKAPPNKERPLLSSNIVSLLPNSADLPELSDLPLLSYNGISITRALSHEAAIAFSTTYRREIGECKKDSETTPREPKSALDLFCHRDQVYDPLRSPKPHDNIRPPTEQPRAEDVVPPEQLENVKQEASAHVARQEGKPEPVKQRTPHVRKEKKVQQDDSKETQNEFQLQLQRQAKQAGSGGSLESIKVEPNIDESKFETPKNSEPERDESKQGSSHNGFHKQEPKKITEELKENDSEKKGAGW
ncbi:hypothetical protein P7C71_g3732, partial [Lecanoromycetidae sp. Uapishka_2]